MASEPVRCRPAPDRRAVPPAYPSGPRITRGHRRGYRLAEHPPACANVCVAASARRPEHRKEAHSRHTEQSPVAQLAEQPAVNRQVTGSSPVGGARSPVAQLAEHSAVNRRVTGSSPVGGAERTRAPEGVLFLVCLRVRRARLLVRPVGPVPVFRGFLPRSVRCRGPATEANVRREGTEPPVIEVLLGMHGRTTAAQRKPNGSPHGQQIV